MGPSTESVNLARCSWEIQGPCVGQGSPEKQGQQDVHMHRLPVMVEAGESTVCSTVSSPRPRAEWALRFKSKGSWLQNPPPLLRTVRFCSGRAVN